VTEAGAEGIKAVLDWTDKLTTGAIDMNPRAAIRSPSCRNTGQRAAPADTTR